MQPHDYAVVVGINCYESQVDLEDLRAATQDAQDFLVWLTQDAGVPRHNIFPGPGVLYEQRKAPRLYQLWDLFGELVKRFRANKGRRLGRRLYVFLSGHGCSGADSDTHYFSVDSNPDQPSMLAAVKYANMVWKANMFAQVLLFMDCCRNEVYWGEEASLNHHLEVVANPVPDRVRFYAFATEPFYKAKEHDWGTQRYHGIFTRALLEGLRGGAARDGFVTTESLRVFLRERVKKLSPKDAPQEPSFGEFKDFPLCEGVPPYLVAVIVKARSPGFAVYFGDNPDRPIAVTPQLVESPDRYRIDLPLRQKFLIDPDPTHPTPVETWTRIDTMDVHEGKVFIVSA
jgi:hypothetical protein